MSQRKAYDARLGAIWHFCTNNGMILGRTRSCGCFYCLKLYKTSEILEWIESEGTAVCPHCGIDSVIPDVPLYRLDLPLLEELHAHFFT
ncbi:hypothetical protein [Deinococcus sp.]|uniref:hypothetical protein n=1 Tax=Deinococcus sp. TaxID=47478 RepID=UPI003CC6C8B6